jgi:DNA polymerase-3 subunit epsilon
MRQVVLDTETTGLEVSQGHRIIEIGCIELVNRRVTGNHWHFYINPDREIDSGAFDVHGISTEFLQDKQLNHELSLLQPPSTELQESCSILDTLLLARQKHPGQKNNLDALCKRYGIDNSNRSLHGALLDARILADVYLAMTGGQTSLGLEAEQGDDTAPEQTEIQRIESGQPLPLWQVDEAAQQANREYIDFLATQHDDPAWR